MAIDYDTANSGVFARLGPIVKAVNDHLTNATTTLPAQLKNIVDKFELSDTTQQVTGLYGLFAGMQGQESGNRQGIAAFSDNIFTDQTTILDQLGILSSSLRDVLPAFFLQMVADAKTVNRNTVTLGTVTAAAGNVGNGIVVVSKILDGYNPPANGAPPCRGYMGLNSELAVSETMRFEVSRDSYRDGAVAGMESFDWHGGTAYPSLGYQGEGSGAGPSLRTAINDSLLTNGDFESFSSDAPSGWTVTAGTPSVTIFGTTTAGEFYRGLSGLKFTGNAATQPYITQSLRGIIARRAYWITARVKASNAAITGDLTIKISGTGWAAGGGTSSITIVTGALPTVFTLYSTLFVAPASLPSDLTLDVGIITFNLGAGKSVYIDDVCLVPATYHGGITALPVQGSTPFVVGDKWTLPNTQDDAGKFQSYLRKKYLMQFPSSWAPNISDGLVA